VTDGILDPSQMEALLGRSGADRPAPAEGDTARGRRARWLRTVDFTRPTKFSTDQERRIRRALDAWSQVAAQRLVAEHRTALELEVIDVQQLTFTNALALLPEGSLFAVIDCEPHDVRMLLSAELPIVLVALERLLGGEAAELPPPRELTDIDVLVFERLMATLVSALSQIWFDISETKLSIAAMETQTETVQVAAGSEPTLALTLETRLEGAASTMTLLIPYAAIAPIAAAFSRHHDDAPVYDPRAAEAVNRELSLVDVTVRAEVAETTLTLDQVLALAPGDVVRLDRDGTGEVTLYADRTAVHRARAGRNGARRAIQVTAPFEETP
jgi:flagellar motor switch protein FliM